MSKICVIGLFQDQGEQQQKIPHLPISGQPQATDTTTLNHFLGYPLPVSSSALHRLQSALCAFQWAI
jgi:hypothetical protein